MLVDVNQHYDLAAAPAFNRRRTAPKWKGKSWARWALGWENISEKCGANLSLGVIDTTIDTSHPALLGKNIQFKSFHRKQLKPSGSKHGTAIAAMLVGNSSSKGWGGLVPGAKLYGANVFGIKRSGRLVSSLSSFMKAIDWMILDKLGFNFTSYIYKRKATGTTATTDETPWVTRARLNLVWQFF